MIESIDRKHQLSEYLQECAELIDVVFNREGEKPPTELLMETARLLANADVATTDELLERLGK